MDVSVCEGVSEEMRDERRRYYDRQSSRWLVVCIIVGRKVVVVSSVCLPSSLFLTRIQ
jgi:hypothetical protein